MITAKSAPIRGAGDHGRQRMNTEDQNLFIAKDAEDAKGTFGNTGEPKADDHREGREGRQRMNTEKNRSRPAFNRIMGPGGFFARRCEVRWRPSR